MRARVVASIVGGQRGWLVRVRVQHQAIERVWFLARADAEALHQRVLAAPTELAGLAVARAAQPARVGGPFRAPITCGADGLLTCTACGNTDRLRPS